MHDLMKKDYLYQELKASIISGEYTDGRKFPKEFELAEKYSVARGTLRMALKQLEDEQFIERIKGKGTYIRYAPEKKRAVITYLLPCPDYMTRIGNFAFRHRQTMEGIMKRCQELNCQMETIAVSPTNSMNDVDWRFLEHLNSESRVITSGWFAPVFNFLKERKCRVFCEYTYNMRIPSPFKDIPEKFQPSRDWFWHISDVPEALESAVGYLWNTGARKIAIASNWLDQPEGIITQGYKDGIKAYGLNGLTMPLTSKMPVWPYLREKLREWHNSEKFDGLILCPRSDDVPYDQIYSNSVLGLPENVKIVLTCCIPESSLFHGTLPMIYFDFFEKGYRAVSELMSEKFIPCEKIIKPVFKDGNSAMRVLETNQYMVEV